ncbi:hypothetical protein COMA2_270030 [Candidatus Nitrospira nitrificans]|uniref:Uncharacterized protein n=1 Tax=Candidatus Nitrospira nitrificans TaxID=1742973 RepID=A0A0S4LHX3_9BACT|nr:hypothetical protein COMA2_270030 [Candidatus Nitrospira nitrificans]
MAVIVATSTHENHSNDRQPGAALVCGTRAVGGYGHEPGDDNTGIENTIPAWLVRLIRAPRTFVFHLAPVIPAVRDHCPQ